MTRIVTTIIIRRPLEVVFAYVTTPQHWRQWHPATLSVRGAVDHPLQQHEQVTEEFQIGNSRGCAVWTVLQREAPHRWVIAGNTPRGHQAQITYILTPQTDGTRFERELAYRPPSLWQTVLNWLVLRPRLRRQSAVALRQLKAVLEQDHKP